MPKSAATGCLTAPLLAVSLLGCAAPSWSVESKPLAGSLTLLNEAPREELEFVVDTSHQGRVHATVNLPGVAIGTPTPTPDVDVPLTEPSASEGQRKLLVAELSADMEHSVVTLPGSGGQLSVLCPSPRCEATLAQLSLRAIDGADLGARGVIVEWSVHAETFGPGEVEPEGARADIVPEE